MTAKKAAPDPDAVPADELELADPNPDQPNPYLTDPEDEA